MSARPCSGAKALTAAGFRARADAATGITAWVRLPDPPEEVAPGGGVSQKGAAAERHNPVVFLHGLGIGVAPYADWVAALPKDRPIVAPEWPNISYGTDLGARYPTPSELADFLERTTQQASDDAAAADELLSPSVSSRSVGPPRKCDVIAHSYGTVVLTGFRRHHPQSVRRCVYIDPVCFLPSFGSYLRYAYDDHLMGWRELVRWCLERDADPAEPMTLANLALASWFIKVRSRDI